jgi:polysaccharide export outer membrane protein
MTSFKFFTFSIATAMLLHGCSHVLETVSLSDELLGTDTLSIQEEFTINVKSLTFENSQNANNDPYPRRLMLTGTGSKANVFDEDNFLNSNFPASSPDSDYLLGIGDKLQLVMLTELKASLSNQLPVETKLADYLIGVGDTLTLIQYIDPSNSGAILPNNQMLKKEMVETLGVVGASGDVLFVGIGKLKAKNRSLNDLQNDVRNILIRNGLASNFQLEISSFKSKKAFLTFTDLGTNSLDNVIPITNLPLTLKEVVTTYGHRSSSLDVLFVSLMRNGQKFRMTARQIFDKSFPRILIEDKDQIEIKQAKLNDITVLATVGSNGRILLPQIGNIRAKDRTLADVQNDIAQVLVEKGLIPNFQLEITDFKSKKFYLISKTSSQQIPLTSSKLKLRELLLSTDSTTSQENDFTIVNLMRNGSTYQMTYQEVMGGRGSNIIIQNNDTIELKGIKYKPGQVFTLSGAGNARMIPIDPSIRETLADILFTPNGALNNLAAKRSEIYLLRGKRDLTAYHLDTQNVSRILVAAKTELRPNDIVYVADRPIISFARTLSEINPLRTLIRDIQSNNIP